MDSSPPGRPSNCPTSTSPPSRTSTPTSSRPRERPRGGRGQGIHLVVTSGWRSAAYQGWLLSQAIARYGSAEEEAKWVSKPEDSKHVTGEALDVGPFDGTLWMQSNASRFGLCQIYSNELWHYELATAYGDSCPPLRDSAAT